MFKNHSFRKAILVLAILALLAGTFASTYIQTIQTDLVAASSRISTNHRELSTMSQKVKPGEEEEPVQAGLPPCSATSGNCKLGPGGGATPFGLFYAVTKQLTHGLVASLFPVHPFSQFGAASQGEQMAILIKLPCCP